MEVTSMPKLVAMLRVKDGILFIEQWLAVMSRLVDEIVVVDNGSTDGTLEIVTAHPKVTFIERTAGFDEGRDKNLVYQLAKKRKGDWMVWLDVDEIFEERLTRSKIEKMINSRFFTKFAFRIINLHGDEEHFEGRFKNLLYQSKHCRLIWKDQDSGYFSKHKIHVGAIQGIKGLTWLTNFRIKHFAALDYGHLKNKTDLYISIDPENRIAYETVRDQRLPRWKWYEFSAHPFLVSLQNCLWNCLMVIRYSQILFRRIIGRKVYIRE